MTLALSKENRIYKKLFTPKPPQRDGLILNVHHTDKNSQKVRFINTCFSKEGNVVALADHEGNIFVIDFSTNKFWNIPKVITSCTAIKFSPYKDSEVLAGIHTGRICVIDTQTGFISGELIGHGCPISHISFANDFMCLTSSICEAILWDLKTNLKVQVLNLEHSCKLKYVSFIPIWQFGTFELKSQIPPLVWFSHEVRNITFSQDGKVMVVGCRTPHLALFLLSNFKLLKFITLPEYIQSLKHVDFIPQLHDGGSNKILAVLSGRGSIYFYDSEQNIIVSELVSAYEISKYDFSTKGSYMSCVLCSGDVNIYDIVEYIVVPIKLKAVKAQTAGKKVGLKKCLQKMGLIKEQFREILEIEKLRMILKEWGEYPDAYRMKIWENLLDLPNNTQQYNSIINHRMIISFEDLCQKYPLEDKRSLKNLKQLLDNLVTWCPFFLHVDYLPLFVFPFVKVFVNKPLICFEAICTIIVNWCQFWFEYFPLPPVNILAMVENVFMEHDPELLDFLIKNNVTSELYAWPILKSAFSEILTAQAWKAFWDHVLTNEPSFLLCGVVAYNVLQRTGLMGLKDERRFKCFYNTHHPINVKKLLAKTYHILAKTSESIHPRQYLNMFQKLKVGEYPNFCDYPKTNIEMKSGKSEAMKDEMNRLKNDELDLYKHRFVNLDKIYNLEMRDEENKRILEMENAIRNQLLEEQDRLQNYYERVATLRHKFHEEDEALSSLKHKIAKEQQLRSRRRYLSSLLDDVRFRRGEKDYKLTKMEDELLYHYSELLKHKYKIEKLLPREEVFTSTQMSEPSAFEKQQEELSREIRHISKIDKPQEYLKVANLATGLAAMDCLIRKIEDELDKEKRGVSVESAADRRVKQLQAETKELGSEVGNLIQLLADLRNIELSE